MAQGPTGILTGHFRENETYGMSRPEGMDSWLLVFTIDGGGFFRTPAGEKRCGPGEAALLRTGTPHTYGTLPGGEWHFVWAHFDRLPQTGLLPDEEVVVCPIAQGGARRQFLRTFRQLLQDSRDRGPFWRELCENHLSRLLLLLAQRLTDGLDPRVRQAARLLSERMTEPFSVDALAGAVGLSASRLSHLFKEETGSSLLETLNGMRLEQAALLMAHAGRTASEAAYDVGFQSYQHFAALFRRRYGRSPSDYRKAMGGGREED